MSTRRRPKVRYLREVWMDVRERGTLKRARIRAGYTQYDLAALCNCTQAAISALETGAMTRCSEDLATAIAKWLDRDVEELFVRHADSRAHRMTNAAHSMRRVTAPVPTARRRGPRPMKGDDAA
ncbi:MAG: helix-turn-helix transcriptional regulator [Actinomycetota bacterium]|nr:helix-turn-helix transcriptional regulator [Actinomycetota bacterium]